MDIAQLQRLLIKEISGVDSPANLMDGWMITKASKFKTSLAIGPDEAWDVGAAEKRVREKTGATDGPNKAYADCFLWYDGTSVAKSGDVPETYGAYKFLVVDVADGELKIMPQALRAAASRLPGSSIPDSDKASIESTLSKLKTKAGIGEDAKKSVAADVEDAPTTLEKIRNLLFPARKDADEMTAEELTAALDERDERLVKSLTETLTEIAKSAAPAGASEDGSGAAAGTGDGTGDGTTPEAVIGLTPEDLTKALLDALAPYNEILEKALDRIEAIETAFAGRTRKSLEGQEGAGTGEGEQTTKPTFGDRLADLAKAHQRGERVALVGPGR